MRQQIASSCASLRPTCNVPSITAIEACHSVAGDSSYMLFVRVASPKALEALVNDSENWILTWGIIYEFMRVATHPRIFPNPLTLEQAHEHVRAVLEGAGVDWDAQVRIDDASPAARPGLDRPAAAAFVAAVGEVAA